MPPRTEVSVFTKIRAIIDPTNNYADALHRLSALPPAYAMCFAFRMADGDTCNGGFRQLRGNSTWVLVPTAIRACRAAHAVEAERLFRQAVLFFHQKRRCGMDASTCESLFDGLDRPLTKSLGDLEDEYYALDRREQLNVEDRLIAIQDAALWGDES